MTKVMAVWMRKMSEVSMVRSEGANGEGWVPMVRGEGANGED
jgi:hypothetical protein